jgi:multidrug resistance efflux pump
MTLSAFSPSDSPIPGKPDPDEREPRREHFIQDKVSIEAPASKHKPDHHRGESKSLPSLRRKLLIVAFVIVAAGVGGFAWLEFGGFGPAPVERLVVHGNIDLRQVALPFNNNERIAAVLVQEGDAVRKGDLLARLDTSRLEPQVAQAAAQVAAQRAAGV